MASNSQASERMMACNNSNLLDAGIPHLLDRECSYLDRSRSGCSSSHLSSNSGISKGRSRSSKICSDKVVSVLPDTDDSVVRKESRLTVNRVDKRRKNDKTQILELFNQIMLENRKNAEDSKKEREFYTRQVANIADNLEHRFSKLDCQLSQISNDHSELAVEIADVKNNCHELRITLNNEMAAQINVVHRLESDLGANKSECVERSEKFSALVKQEALVYNNRLREVAEGLEEGTIHCMSELGHLSNRVALIEKELCLETKTQNDKPFRDLPPCTESDSSSLVSEFKILGKPWRPQTTSRARARSHSSDFSEEEIIKTLNNLSSRRSKGLQSHYHADREDSLPRNSRRRVNVPEYDGSYDASIFLKQVASIAELEQYDEKELCTIMMTSLKGPAREVLSFFSHRECLTSKKIAKALMTRFSHRIQADVARATLTELRQERKQTARQLAMEVEKLVNKGYGQIDRHTKEIMSVEAFLQSVSEPEIKFHLRVQKPKTLEEAVNLAERLEAALRQTRAGNQGKRTCFTNPIKESGCESNSPTDKKRDLNKPDNHNKNKIEYQYDVQNGNRKNWNERINSHQGFYQPNHPRKFNEKYGQRLDESQQVDLTHPRGFQGNGKLLRPQGQPRQY
jgi:hypothetical protein